jgi:hypothetical protein
MEQRVVMKFLVNEGVKPADIYRRLQAQYGDETLSRSKTFEGCKRFKDGRTSVIDDPYCLLSFIHMNTAVFQFKDAHAIWLNSFVDIPNHFTLYS